MDWNYQEISKLSFFNENLIKHYLDGIITLEEGKLTIENEIKNILFKQGI